VLDEARRLRSERAKQIDKKRLENQSKTKKPKTHKPANCYAQVAASPKEALARIEADLELSRFPAIDDVRMILVPKKLSNRADVLRRILTNCFDLRGKCIPRCLLGDESIGVKQTFLFVTECPIRVLGLFVLSKLEEMESKVFSK